MYKTKVLTEITKILEYLKKIRCLILEAEGLDENEVKAFEEVYQELLNASLDEVLKIRESYESMKEKAKDFQYCKQVVTSVHSLMELTVSKKNCVDPEKLQEIEESQQTLKKHILFLKEVTKKKAEKWKIQEQKDLRSGSRVEGTSNATLEDIANAMYMKDPTNYVVRTLDDGEVLVSGVLLKGYCPQIARKSKYNRITKNYEFHLAISKNAASQMFNFFLTMRLDLTTAEMIDVFVVAEKYDIPNLQYYCERKILKALTPENSILVLKDICIKELKNLDHLKEAVMEYIMNNLSEVKKTEAWNYYAALMNAKIDVHSNGQIQPAI